MHLQFLQNRPFLRSPGLRHRKCRPFGVKLPDFVFTIPRQHTSRRYSLFWATIGRCAENAANLPEHRFLAAIFLTDDITRVLRSCNCDDDDNEHVLLSKNSALVLWRLSTAWCWPPSSPRSRASCFMTCLCLQLVGETVYLLPAPYNPYDCNCLDGRCARGRPYTLGHTEALVAALLSLLMRDVSVAVFQGYVCKVEGGRLT